MIYDADNRRLRMTTHRLAGRTGRTAIAMAAIWVLLGVASAQATVTVGSPLTATFTGSFQGRATEINFALGEPGSQVTSPVNGTIVTYRVKVDAGSSGQFAIRVIRPAAGGEFTGAGTSTPVTPPGTGLQTFSANLPIRAGDFVGLDLLSSTSLVGSSAAAPGSTVYEWGFSTEVLADGATAPPKNTYPGTELAFNAEVAPTNTFSFGATQRNKKKGTATLNLTLPNPGELSGSGNGANVASAAGAVISKAVGAGPAQLLIKAKGKKKKKLNEKGKVKLNVAVTYTPTSGTPATQSLKVKLKKKL
jgi:hypothetical protein